MDGRGEIWRLFGGYSPKLYDGHFLQHQAQTLEEECAGATIIADEYFCAHANIVPGVSFVTPYRNPPTKKRKRDGKDLQQLTKQQQTFNKKQKALRAKVEEPFGQMKVLFPTLKQPWAESDKQLDCLVWMAAAIVNIKNKHH